MKMSCKFLVCLMTVLAGSIACGETNTLTSPERYHIIRERNCFDLKPPSPVPAFSQPDAVPTEDLFLTGLSKFPSNQCACFMLTGPGGRVSYFILREGEQNEWLEVRDINYKSETVKALLKKPVVRARGVGTEIVLSFQAHGMALPAQTLAPPLQEQQKPATTANQPATAADSKISSPDPADQATQQQGTVNVFAPHSFPQD